MPISHTKSYKRYRDASQELFDGVLLLCHAVPALKAYIKAVENGTAPKLPDPDHFEVPQPADRLRECARLYRGALGKMILLSSHGFFESYCKGMFTELIEYHGGVDDFSARGAARRLAKASISDNASVSKSIGYLRTYPKKHRRWKYEKHRTRLVEAGFPMPAECFSSFGIQCFAEAADRVTAVGLPALLEQALGVPLAKEQQDEYQRINDARNRAAHGNTTKVALRDAIGAAKTLRDIARMTDDHVVRNFFILDVGGPRHQR